MYFVKEKYNAIAEKHGVKGVHAMKIVGAEFKKLTDAQKAVSPDVICMCDGIVLTNCRCCSRM
jgi:hypothetical protein